MFKLQFKDSPSRSIWLVGEKVTLGSHADNTLVLDGLGIEEFHAELLIEPSRVILRSTPGTCIVNDLPVDDHYELGANDELRIGKERFLIIDPKRQPTAAGLKTVKPGQAAQQPADWVLEPDHPKLKSLDFSIRGRSILGRAKDCELSVPYKLLSREHAEFWVEDGKLHLKDLGSSNGSFVNGERIEQATLADGDKVAFAKLVFAVKGRAAKPAVSKAKVDNNLTMDRTMIRPALNLDAELAEREASRASRSIDLDAVELTDTPPQPETAKPAAGSKRTPVLALVSVAVLGIAAAAWFFLQA